GSAPAPRLDQPVPHSSIFDRIGADPPGNLPSRCPRPVHAAVRLEWLPRRRPPHSDALVDRSTLRFTTPGARALVSAAIAASVFITAAPATPVAATGSI